MPMVMGSKCMKPALTCELYYSIETSITLLNMGKDVEWQRGKVECYDEEIRFVPPGYVIQIKSIQAVGRPIPASAITSILKQTHHSSYILIEYSKMGRLGLVYSAQTLVVGEQDTVEELKVYFREFIPGKFWGSISLDRDEVRLLYLVFSGMLDMRILVPMFGDVNTVERLLHSLIVKNMITPKGQLTPEGLEYIKKHSEGLPPTTLASLHSNVDFERFFRRWQEKVHMKYSKASKVRVSLITFDEPLTGFVQANGLWYLLKVLNIGEFDIWTHPVDGEVIRSPVGDHGELIIAPKNEELLLEIAFLIYSLTGIVELDDEVKILNLLSMGVREPHIIEQIIDMKYEQVKSRLLEYLEKRLITPSLELTTKGKVRLSKLYERYRNPMIENILGSS